MPTGYVSFINRAKHYGFIDSPELNIDQIFFHSTNCKKKYTEIHKGDQVLFEFDPNLDYETGAKEVSFIRNASLDHLKRDFSNNTTLKGYLKKIDGNYYVKDKETYIFIRLVIAGYETNIEEVYEKKIDSIVEYKIITFTKNNKIRAININREYLPNCKLLTIGNETEGQIIEITSYGFLIIIYDNIKGFLPNSLARKSNETLEVGDLINITCISTGDNYDNVIFDLTKNIYKEIQLKYEQVKFIESLRNGDRYIGNVKDIHNFGVFISFGLAEGLLHINHILGETNTLSKDSRKAFSKLIKEIFKKGIKIEIIYDYQIDDKISLLWDINSDINKELFLEVYIKYKSLL
jgi:ribosomal protein S1